MRPIGIAILLAFAGTILAALYTFVLGLAGAPGAALGAALTRGGPHGRLARAGLAVSVLGQLYMALAWAAFVVMSTKTLIGSASGLATWVTWAAAWWVACAPAMFALKDSVAAENKTVQHVATTFTAPATAIGFWLLLAVPRLLAVWAWVPHL